VPGVTSHVIRLVGGEAYYLAAVAHGVYRCRADACTPELLGSGSEFDANASFAAWQSDASGHLVRVVP
jgi:hypothetical protein